MTPPLPPPLEGLLEGLYITAILPHQDAVEPVASCSPRVLAGRSPAEINTVRFGVAALPPHQTEPYSFCGSRRLPPSQFVGNA